MSEPLKPIARVEGHLDKLRLAGIDTQAFFEALIGIRDDNGLSTSHREALYKIVAMESFIWYLEALNGAPVDRFKAAEEAAKIAAEHDVAIKKRVPGDTAGELAKRDITYDPARAAERQRKAMTPPSETSKPDAPKPQIPKPENTVRQRPPKKNRPGPRKKAGIKPGVTKLDRPKKKS